MSKSSIDIEFQELVAKMSAKDLERKAEDLFIHDQQELLYWPEYFSEEMKQEANSGRWFDWEQQPDEAKALYRERERNQASNA